MVLVKQPSKQNKKAGKQPRCDPDDDLTLITLAVMDATRVARAKEEAAKASIRYQLVETGEFVGQFILLVIAYFVLPVLWQAPMQVTAGASFFWSALVSILGNFKKTAGAAKKIAKAGQIAENTLKRHPEAQELIANNAVGWLSPLGQFLPSSLHSLLSLPRFFGCWIGSEHVQQMTTQGRLEGIKTMLYDKLPSRLQSLLLAFIVLAPQLTSQVHPPFNYVFDQVIFIVWVSVAICAMPGSLFNNNRVINYVSALIAVLYFTSCFGFGWFYTIRSQNWWWQN